MRLLESPRQQATATGRYVELDGLRGIAVIGVLLFHVTDFYDVYVPGEKPPLPFTVPQGRFGVELFFLISGFVILATAERRSAREFAIARFARIYPVYWLCILITTAVVLTSHLDGLRRQWYEVLGNLTMLQSLWKGRDVDGVYWSLGVELLFYATVAVLLMIFGRLSNRVLVGTTIVWTVVAIGVLIARAVAPQDQVIFFIKTLTNANFACMFLVGMVAYLIRSGRPGPWRALIAVPIVGAVVSAALRDGQESALWTAGIIAAFVVITLLPEVPVLRARLLVWLGALSYPLYLLHQNISYVVIDAATPTVGRPVATGVAVAVVVLLAWVVHQLFEKQSARWTRTKLTELTSSPSAASGLDNRRSP
ncbi:acyltransferase family protein [Epidermidibacterium keratini]|uniref:Acyltransferase family protein n=1 Tax=Epidermidibacterium keratini TaxID=1891644 RepID=A0A7L4YPM1_9ACTN|nr:acyltransferase [Epidermidibacterium keratini]QHC00507.1 acyltransferase family protein [Epidermidibacterium keratini]